MSGNDETPNHCNGCPRHNWFTVAEAMKYAKCGRTLFYDYIALGLKARKVKNTGMSRFLQSEIDAFFLKWEEENKEE